MCMNTTRMGSSATRSSRWSRRVVILEHPAVVEELQALAERAGHSLGAEIRAANRFWIRAVHAQEEEQEWTPEEGD